MKRILLILSFINVITSTYAQITISSIAKPTEDITEIIPYDSTRNWLGNKNVQSYIGQTLYVNGMSKNLQKYGYSGFKVAKESGITEGRWGEPAQEKHYATNYENLVGKYYIVLDVQKDSRDSYVFSKYYWFKLQNQNDEDEVVWFRYDSELESTETFPFITISHFNYLKDAIIGKKYVLRYSTSNNTISTCLRNFDMRSGESFTQRANDMWECVDITIEDEYFKFVAVVKNQDNATSYIPINTILHGESKPEVFEETYYNELVNEFGEDNVDMVRQGIIKVGMPTTLLILSWGKPTHIKKSSHGPDQWIYSSKYSNDVYYVYVENNEIKAWNQ